MEFALLDGGEDGIYNGIDFAEISKIFTMLVAFLFAMVSFGRFFLEFLLPEIYSVNC